MTTEPMFIDSPSVETLRSGGFLWTTPDMYDPVRKRPAFTMQVVAEVFFGMSGSWLRKHQRQSNESVDLGKVEPLRTEAKYHSYRLYDIERLAHAFASHQVIDGVRLERVVTMVRIVAQLYGYLPMIQPPSLDSDDELPLGHVGFSAVVPKERAAALHLITGVLRETGGVIPPDLSCVDHGSHEETPECDSVLPEAMRSLRSLENHLLEHGEID